MKLKFFIAGAAIVAGLASAVSCQDLSKDLTALQNKVNSLESTVQNLQDKIDGGAVITSVTPTNSGIVITLSNGNKYEITNGVNGKDGSNGTNGKDGKDGKDGSVVTIGENGNWFIDGEDTGLAAQGEDGVPGAFYVPNPETGCFDVYAWDEEKGEYVVTPTEISFLAPGTITAVYDPETGVLTLFNVEGGEGELGIVTIGGAATEITSIELFDYTPAATYKLGSTAVGQDAVFVEGLPGAITFNKGDEAMRPTLTIVVKVDPASYDLSANADKIQLVNTAGTVFDMVVASVKKHEGVATKATTNTGLWDVTFELTEYGDGKAFDAATKDPKTAGKYVLFAIKAGEAVSDYDVRFEHEAVVALGDPTNAKSGLLEDKLYIDKKANVLANYANRVLVAVPDYEWKGAPAYSIKSDKSNVQLATGRTTKPDYAYIGGTDLTIGSLSEEVKAMYVTLDIDYATDSGVSEKNAWLSYDIEGLDTVVEGTSLKINVKDPKAVGDEIGFRVFAVNYNGTLVDPDGVAFYLNVGKSGESWGDAVTATMSTPDNFLTPFGTKNTIGSSVVAFEPKQLPTSTSYTYEFNLDYASASDFANTQFSIEFYAKDGKTYVDRWKHGDKVTTSALYGWETSKPTAVMVRAIPSVAGTYTDQPKGDLHNFKDGKSYSGTFTVTDANNFVVATLKVTFVKTPPTVYPDGFSIKTGQLDEKGTYNCYLKPDNWAAATATLGTMAMSDVFNFPAGEAGNFDIIFDASADDGKGNKISVPVKGTGTLSVAKAFIDNKTSHTTSIAYNYGKISSEAKDDKKAIIDYTLSVKSFPTIFDCIYNNTYSWDWDWTSNGTYTARAGYAAVRGYSTFNTKGMPELAPAPAPPAVDPFKANTPLEIIYEDFDKGTIGFDMIMGKSTWDSAYNKLLVGGGYSASLKFAAVTDAKFVTTASGLEEYYTVAPDLLVAPTKIVFAAKSGATNPTVDVPSTLVLKMQDMYSHTVEVNIPVIVKKR